MTGGGKSTLVNLLSRFYDIKSGVQKAMDNLMKDRTVFIIAHRLSTIKNADRIAVINHGELVELGSHDELMAIEKGQYRELYEMQFRNQER